MNCPVAKLCGGCELLKVSYAKQGELKRENVQKLIDDAKLKITVQPVHMAESAIGYRNKVIYGQITLQEISVVGNADRSVIHPSNPSIQKLLAVLGNEELSAGEIMDRLNLSHRPTFQKNYLNPALEQGVIEMTIPEKPNSRNQKYRKK